MTNVHDKRTGAKQCRVQVVCVGISPVSTMTWWLGDILTLVHQKIEELVNGCFVWQQPKGAAVRALEMLQEIM